MSQDDDDIRCQVMWQLEQDKKYDEVVNHLLTGCLNCITNPKKRFGGKEMLFPEAPPSWIKVPESEKSDPAAWKKYQKKRVHVQMTPEEFDQYLVDSDYSDQQIASEISRFKKCESIPAWAGMKEIRRKQKEIRIEKEKVEKEQKKKEMEMKKETEKLKKADEKRKIVEKKQMKDEERQEYLDKMKEEEKLLESETSKDSDEEEDVDVTGKQVACSESPPINTVTPPNYSLVPKTTVNVQLNMWSMNLTKLVEPIIKCSFSVELRTGNTSNMITDKRDNVSIRDHRRSLNLIFEKWFERNHRVFKTGITRFDVAYDGVGFFYTLSSNVIGTLYEFNVKCTLREQDFDREQWTVANAISKNNDTRFKIKVSSNYLIYTTGSEARTPRNLLELSGCLNVVTNQELLNAQFLFYENGIYQESEENDSELNRTVSVKNGFKKSCQVSIEDNGKMEGKLTIDVARQAFFKSGSLLKFVTSKFLDDKFSNYEESEKSVARSELIDYDTILASRIEKELMEGDPRALLIIRSACENLKRVFFKQIHSGKEYPRFDIRSIPEFRRGEEYLSKKDGSEVSTSQHYLEVYSVKIRYPQLVAKIISEYVPLEALQIVPGEIFHYSKMTEEMQEKFAQLCDITPDEHYQEICSVFTDQLKLNAQNTYLAAFKVSMDSLFPISTTGNVLGSPALGFGKAAEWQKKELTRPQPIETERFRRAAILQTVWILLFKKKIFSIHKFPEELYNRCSKLGMTFSGSYHDWKVFEELPETFINIKQRMMEAKKAGVSLVISIEADDSYIATGHLNYYADKLGVNIFHLPCSTSYEISMGSEEHLNRVAREINMICGGLNSDFRAIIDEKPVDELLGETFYRGIQFIGLSLPSGNNQNMIGLCYTLESLAETRAFAYKNEVGAENILWEQNIQKCLTAYQEATHSRPGTVVIFGRVHNQSEVDGMRRLVNYFQAPNSPSVIIVVIPDDNVLFSQLKPAVGSCKHINATLGTCVDLPCSREIMKFALHSQSRVEGTARPTNYSVLVNQAGWSGNEIKTATHVLTFLDQVSYEKSEVPNILLAAENKAKREYSNLMIHLELVRLHENNDDLVKQYDDVPEGYETFFRNHFLE